MGWSVGFDRTWHRWIGYGVPAYCDHPGCTAEIDRGLAHVCSDEQPYGGEHGCGLYFCGEHQNWRGRCERCAAAQLTMCPDCDEEAEEDLDDNLVCPACERKLEVASYPSDWSPFPPKPEHPRWLQHLLTDTSWAEWRRENPREVEAMKQLALASAPPGESAP